MQLSNEPAEQLAAELVASGNGAFELCGYVSGGLTLSYICESSILILILRSGSEAMEAALKLARQVQHSKAML
jgi:E3 ubiquitin-protein ligase TRIP12